MGSSAALPDARHRETDSFYGKIVMDLNLLSSVFSSSSSPVSARLVIVRAAMGIFFFFVK